MTDHGSLLIVEDDARLCELLRDYLAGQGFAVTAVGDGRSAVERIERAPPDAVVLDLMLPRMSGTEVLRAVRPRFTGGVLILTATKTEVDQVVGLELGADDYVTKPVEPRLLLARLRSLLRRVRREHAPPPPERLTLGALVIDRARREVFHGDASVELTGAEFSVLWCLAARAGDVLTRDELYAEALGARYDGLDRSLDVHVSRLRRKLADRGFPAGDLKSVRGTGYLLAKG